MMPVVFQALAAWLVVAHMAFVAFAALGGALAVRWPRVVWVHLPAAAWAVYIELTGGICPLTPWENMLRLRAGLTTYEGDFIGRYLIPVLYPEGLTRTAQIVIGLFVLALNVGLYAFVYFSRRSVRR